VSEQVFYDRLLLSWTLLAVPTFVLLLFVRVPLGRYSRPGWGPSLPHKLGWFLMESPSIWWFPLVFFSGNLVKGAGNYLFFALWMLHYVHRDVVYPVRLREKDRRIPFLIAAFAFTFQIVNGYLNGAHLGRIGRTYDVSWFAEPVFVGGMALFFLGMAINLRADQALISLRRPGESGYKIPRGGLFEKVSCPNYLGEIIEWSGWALATWSLAGLSFAIWTVANLAPRALAHHRWYREEFADYPPERRAIFPGLL
jgi:protein-S-isoprenylcysteine O-methyltransferase Ste14